MASRAPAATTALPDAEAPPTRLARLAGATLARLHEAGGGNAGSAPVLDRIGRELWRAASQGHACIDVDAAAAAVLEASPVVDIAPENGDAVASAAFAPTSALVLDGRKLYPQRFWAAETRLAAGLLVHARHDPLAQPAAIGAALDRVFGPADAALPDMQRRAVECSLTRGLLLLSGGPGTGKTTSLARLIGVVRQLAPATRIAVAAPTGKAAARAMQAMSAGLDGVADANPAGPQPRGGLTLHRLLGSRGPGRGFSHGPDNPLPYDLVVVDEASMIDLEMADALLAALGPTTRLVLAGDRDQLASVEPGAVFGSACDVRDGPIADCGVILSRNYRQRDAAQIVAFADAVRSGQAADGFELAAGGPVVLVEADDGMPSAVMARIAERVAAHHRIVWSEVLEAGAQAADDCGLAARMLAAYGSLGLLCALRDGPLGAARANREIDLHARRELGIPDARTWYPGRLVIVRGNSAETGLFNGEIGVCVALAGQLAVVFARSGEPLAVPVLQMPACDDAWALTIHQSQGSEFDAVLLVPAPAGHPLATRESLYTGITRAKSRLEIFGSAAAVAWASMHPTRRDGDLARRLSSQVHFAGRIVGAGRQ